MPNTLTRTSAMASNLMAIQKQFLFIPTTDASMAANALVKKGVADLERGHCDPGTLMEIAMTLGRVEALAEERLPQRHRIFEALCDAKITMREMIRTAA